MGSSKMGFGIVSQLYALHSCLTSLGNCDPRLPAAHFLVKKEGPNKGKWFYTCQESKENGCGFFLWDDNAVGREMRAVINNARSEPDQLRTPADASRDKLTIEGHNAASNKWIQDLGKKKEDDEFGEWPLSQEDEEKVVQAAKQSIPGAYPETPRKAIKTNQFLTPSSKRKREEEYLPTPVTTNKGDDVFNSPSTNRRGGMRGGNEPFGLRSPSETPTPSRFRDASVSAHSQGEETHYSYDITEGVIELLKDQHIDDETTSNLRTLLNRHALRISGIAKGRDISRLALKSKDGKIAELQQRINALEVEREMDTAIIRQLKSEMAHGPKGRDGS